MRVYSCQNKIGGMSQGRKQLGADRIPENQPWRFWGASPRVGGAVGGMGAGSGQSSPSLAPRTPGMQERGLSPEQQQQFWR